MENARFIVRIGVVDTNTNDMHSIDVYMQPDGRVVGLDSEWIASSGLPDDPVYSPYSGQPLDIAW